MTVTEHRPAPLPPQPGDTQPGTARPRKPHQLDSRHPDGELKLPQGAFTFQWHYEGPDGRSVKAKGGDPVPVNDAGQRTHIEMVCDDCPGWGMWKSVKAKADPLCTVHRSPLRPAESRKQQPAGTQSPWAQMWDSQRDRVRALILPTAATLAVGVAADQADLPWWGEMAQFTAAGAVVWGSWWTAKMWLARQARRRGDLDPADETAGRRKRELRARRARLAGYCGLTAAAWVEIADVVGIDATAPSGVALVGALIGAGVVLSRPYLRYADTARTARPVETPADTSPPVVEEPVDDGLAAARADAADWKTTVAVPGGLAGTVVDLTTWEQDPGGRKMVIRNEGRRAALTDEKMKQALPLIAGAFDVPISSIGWVVEHEGSPGAVLLMVQPNSPLNQIVPGKDVDIVDPKRPVAHMGLRMDGRDLVTRLFTPGWGAPSRLILGTKGAGKTELIRRLVTVMLKARFDGPEGPRRLVAPFLHDPKRGADYGAFRRQVCGFSVDSDTLHMIVEAVIREMDRRYDALAGVVWEDDKGRKREGEKPFDPYTMGPIISIIMDEFHIDAKDEKLMAKFDPMARKMRAACIEVNGATHLATIGDTGSQGFRDMIAGGEAWLLRTTMGLNGALATGGTLAGDPRALPRVPGMVLQASGDDTTVQARIAYDEDVYDLLYDDDNRSRIQPVWWPQETLDAFGKDFCEWMRASQERALGSSAVAAPKTFKPAAGGRTGSESVDDRNARAGVLLILSGASGPLRRAEIAESPLWTWSTKSMTNALRALQDAAPPLIRKVDGSNGAYEITGAGRDLVRASDEQMMEETFA